MPTPLEPFESELPDSLRDALHAAVRDSLHDRPRDEPRTTDHARDAARIDRIMSAVRAVPLGARSRVLPTMRRSRWRRRGMLSPIGGVVTTLVMALAVLLRLDHASPAGNLDAYTKVVGDSVVPVSDTEAIAARNGSLRDAHVRDHWLDTLHIVELVLHGPSIHSASALGAFNRWQRSATPLARVALNEWRARVLVPRDALPYASRVTVLVNDAQIIPTTPR